MPRLWGPSLVSFLSFLLTCLCLCKGGLGSGFSMQDKAVVVVFPPQSPPVKMDMAMADFGRPKYGGYLTGKLVYPTEDRRSRPASQGDIRCSGSVPCQYGCSDFREANPPFTIPKTPGQPIIMIIDRGPANADPPCWLITKAWNAQIAGADALLILNDQDGEMVTAVAPDEENMLHLLDQLTISAALIGKSDGQMLKELYKSNEHVSVKISWDAIIPRSAKVHMELWTNFNDECGTLCDEQRDFIKDMKPVAIALQQAGVLEFEPHYLLWMCPAGYEDSQECQSSCILNGKYCAPDPDGSVTEGFSGRDVLELNIRQLCFARVSAKSGTPWLWWSYAEALYESCSTGSNKFTPECAEQVFKANGGPQLVGGNGLVEWNNCINQIEYPDNSKVSQILEDELDAQHGRDGEPGIAILPTIRINHAQYRGTLEHTGVTRALCAAYPKDAEPSVCKEAWVSEDECEVDGPGYVQCRVGDPATNGRTRCINTFSGYKCDCGQGWVSATDPNTGEEVCEDLNECLATSIPMKDPDCSCARCACINLPGSFKCTGELPNKCTEANNYNGCWRAKMEDNKMHHACRDSIYSYKQRASRGLLMPGESWATCSCPACFSTVSNQGTAKNSCRANCPMDRCSTAQGMCMPEPIPGEGGSWLGMAFAVLLTALVTSLLLYGVYNHYLRQRMHGEMRDIMAQYMPLGDEPNDGSGRGGTAVRGHDPSLAMEAGGVSSGGAYTPVLPPTSNGAVYVESDGGRGRGGMVGNGGAQIPLGSLKSNGVGALSPPQSRQGQKQEQQKQQDPLISTEDKSGAGEEKGGRFSVVFDGASSQGPL